MIMKARLGGELQPALPPRSMVGQLTLDQHIGVRIPGGQPKQALHRTLSNLLDFPLMSISRSLSEICCESCVRASSWRCARSRGYDCGYIDYVLWVRNKSRA